MQRKFVNRGRVQTTWTNEGEGGYSNDHLFDNKIYLVKVSKYMGRGVKIAQILSTWFVHAP